MLGPQSSHSSQVVEGSVRIIYLPRGRAVLKMVTSKALQGVLSCCLLFIDFFLTSLKKRKLLPDTILEKLTTASQTR